MVKMLGGDVYINSIGGINLYSKEVFKKEGIELYFIKTHDFTYKQYGDDFIPNLSNLAARATLFNHPQSPSWFDSPVQ